MIYSSIAIVANKANSGCIIHAKSQPVIRGWKISYIWPHLLCRCGIRDESRAAPTSKMELFVIIVNGWKPLTTITKHSILDTAAAIDPPLDITIKIAYNELIGYTSLFYHWISWYSDVVAMHSSSKLILKWKQTFRVKISDDHGKKWTPTNTANYEPNNED